ncbi:hypothetical protein [Candidatus Burkholderia verschuerenii]|uniref:hypothetical protein n=1 Tax=Candidatus Burkholderia verschuerenii TaxID=242163 RepID=UPI0018DC7592|nr:hypothetical protein [Candidatus Burkholderia verschuerenii]
MSRAISPGQWAARRSLAVLASSVAMLLMSGCGILRCGGTSLYGVAVSVCA